MLAISCSEPLAPGVEPKWRMVVLGPQATEQYEWLDEKQLPVRSMVGNAADPSTQPSPQPSSSTGGGSSPGGAPSPAPGPEPLSDPERPTPKQPTTPEDGKENGK